VTQTATRLSASGQSATGNRKTVSVPARLTWRDASGTLRFASVVIGEVSDVEAFVECKVPALIPLYRLVHLQVERQPCDPQLPKVLRDGKVLSAVYGVGARKASTGTPGTYALRLLVEPKVESQPASFELEPQLAIAN
jgi:hypothetical protein